MAVRGWKWNYHLQLRGSSSKPGGFLRMKVSSTAPTARPSSAQENLRHATLGPTEDVHHVRHRFLDFHVRFVDAAVMICIF